MTQSRGTQFQAFFLKAGVVLFLAFYHLIPVFHLLFGRMSLFGKNIYIVIPALYFLIAMGLTFFKISTNNKLLIYFFLVIYLFLTGIAVMIYEIDLAQFFVRRFIFLPFFFGFVLFYFLSNRQNSVIALKLFLGSILFQCLFGVLHYHFFSGYIFLSEDNSMGLNEGLVDTSFLNIGALRESGTMISSSAFAYTLLCAMFVIGYIKDIPFGLSNWLIRITAIIFIFYGILLSGSRGPIILSLCIILFMLIRKDCVFGEYSMSLLFSLLILGGIIYFGFFDRIEAMVFTRTINEGTGGRFEKLQLVLDFLSNDLYLLIGVPDDVVNSTRINGLYFSDNSFGLILIKFGIMGLMPIIAMLYGGWRFVKLTRMLIPVIAGVVCLSTTNSILWEPSIFYYLVSMSLLFYSKDDSLTTIK